MVSDERFGDSVTEHAPGILKECRLRSRTRIDLLFTMSEITHATSSRSDACETVFASRTVVVWRSASARLRLRLRRARFVFSCVAAPREAQRAKRGGARRDRTDDLLLAKQALSQLSYGPLKRMVMYWWSSDSLRSACRAEAPQERRLVGLGRLELPTSRLSSARSNQLSYKP
jgi:hypothetical protein